MNYQRIAQLYEKLDAELKKVPVNQKRVDEINHYIAKEFGGDAPKPAEGSFWSYFLPLPSNWRMYVTAALSAFVAFNSQIHLVSQDWQNAILAAAVALGFWAVNSTQNLNFEKIKSHLASLRK